MLVHGPFGSGLPNCGDAEDEKGTRVGSVYENTMATMAARANENRSVVVVVVVVVVAFFAQDPKDPVIRSVVRSLGLGQ